VPVIRRGSSRRLMGIPTNFGGIAMAAASFSA
jgi:hypothetical protein